LRPVSTRRDHPADLLPLSPQADAQSRVPALLVPRPLFPLALPPRDCARRYMSTLYLLRHAQASFGAADYDALSPLGLRQATRLGEALRARGVRPDVVLSG